MAAPAPPGAWASPEVRKASGSLRSLPARREGQRRALARARSRPGPSKPSASAPPSVAMRTIAAGSSAGNVRWSSARVLGQQVERLHAGQAVGAQRQLHARLHQRRHVGGAEPRAALLRGHITANTPRSASSARSAASQCTQCAATRPWRSAPSDSEVSHGAQPGRRELHALPRGPRNAAHSPPPWPGTPSPPGTPPGGWRRPAALDDALHQRRRDRVRRVRGHAHLRPHPLPLGELPDLVARRQQQGALPGSQLSSS